MANFYLDTDGLTYFFYKLGLIHDTKLTFDSRTSAEWAGQNQLVSQANTVYVYKDRTTKEDENGNTINIAGFKLGDGGAYVVDLPFLTVDEETFNQHVQDEVRHITSAERTFWNNKDRCYLSNEDNETLVFTKN